MNLSRFSIIYLRYLFIKQAIVSKNEIIDLSLLNIINAHA